MEYLLETLQDSAIISNVISVVVLGVLGIITKLILGAIGSINIEKTQLLLAKTSYERLDKIAQMVELTATLYKDAVLGSNLASNTKVKVLEDFAKIEAAYVDFVKKATEKPTAEVEQPTLVEEVIQTAGQDILAQLREQLEEQK
jgi:hypothetical protein